MSSVRWSWLARLSGRLHKPTANARPHRLRGICDGSRVDPRSAHLKDPEARLNVQYSSCKCLAIVETAIGIRIPNSVITSTSTQKRCAVIAVDDVRFRYSDDAPWALKGVSLEVEPGQILGLLGPNGAGKSTLMSIIAGLLMPNEGRVTWRGGERRAVRLALVPQESAFYPMLTCRENLAFFGGVQGVGGAALATRIEQAVTIAGLEQVINQRADELSGGLRRRLNLAIGLLNDPEILLLDEPTVGVDVQSRSFILAAIESLRAGGTTVI